jgi:TolB-like protein
MKLSKSCLFILLFVYYISINVFSQEATLAVLDFENNSLINAQEYSSLSKGLADILISELSRISSIKVVERRYLKALIDKIKLSQAGIISENASIQVGKLVGAQNLVFGGFIVMPDRKIRIDIRIVEVETGLTIKAADETGKTKQFLKLIKRLCIKILEKLDIKLSKSEIKFLRESKKLDMKAMILFSKGLEAEDIGQFKEAERYYLQALKIEPQFQQARVRIEQLIEDRKQKKILLHNNMQK